MISQAAWIFILITSLLSFFGSFNISKYIRNFALKKKILDDPKSNPKRKKQKEPIPLLGGTGFSLVALFVTLLTVLIISLDWFELDLSFTDYLENIRLLWVFPAVLILIVGGFLDDKYNLSPKYQVIFINLALIVTVFLGNIKIDAFSYPLNEIIPNYEFLHYLLAYAWLGFCIAATKFLDGHDGLVSTVGIIALLTIGSVSLFDNVNQPILFIFALIWALAIAGFLPFNFPNAKMYLGEGGSEIIGFSIGLLSILSGAKVATAGTVIGWFIIDLCFVWLLRILDRRNPLTSGDRLHWHFRLVDLGLNKIQVLVITAFILLITAHSGLLVDTENKIYILIGQAIFLILIFFVTFWFSRKQRDKLGNKQ